MPHNINAKCYDYVFSKRFGTALDRLSDFNISEINKLLVPKKKNTILDFGAGTGRLSIPLARQGHRIFSIDKSQAMLDVLNLKIAGQQLDITTTTNIQEIENNNTDIAIAIFTVLAYITDLKELQLAIKNIFNKLTAGGYFMFDLENINGYKSIVNNRNGIVNNTNRTDFNDLVQISFDPNDATLANYHESVSVICNNETFNYSLDFQIRFWDIAQIINFIQDLGFQHSNRFVFGNATYFVFQKA